VPFVFTVDGQKVRSDDLTLDEIVAVEQLTGVGWYQLNPVESAAQCRAFLVQIHARTRSREDAEKLVGAMTAREAAAGIDFTKDDDRPIEFDDGMPVVDPKEDTAGPAMT
jgi:hypothetical protein